MTRHLRAIKGSRPEHALVPRSHVTNRRHPTPAPAVELYDRTNDPDRPNVPYDIALALSLVCGHALVPGSVERHVAVDSATLVKRWLRGESGAVS